MKNKFNLFKIHFTKTAAGITTFCVLIINSLQVFSQAAEPVKQVKGFPEWLRDPVFYLAVVVTLLLLFTIYALYKANNSLMRIIDPEYFAEKEKVSKPSIQKIRKESFLKRTYKKLLGSVPVEKEADILLDHDYDGIKELDNNLPPWWKYGFYFTIVFSFFYLIIYHVSGTGKLQLEEYETELKAAADAKAERIKLSKEDINENTVVMLEDPQLVNEGKLTYEKFCVACHRADLGGQVGPNLTDEYWIHGGGIHNIFKTITYGVPDKGMISWKSQLSPKQIQQVASFILSHKGTNPPGAKEAQGDIWTEPKSDSLNISSDTTSLNKMAINNSGEK